MEYICARKTVNCDLAGEGKAFNACWQQCVGAENIHVSGLSDGACMSRKPEHNKNGTEDHARLPEADSKSY